MKAIILAAGRSSRLLPLTRLVPKGLLEVAGRTILERQLDTLEALGVTDVLVVVGHQKEVIREALGARVRYSDYDAYDRTNNLHTLWSVQHELDGDTLCLFADVLCDREIVAEAARSDAPFCLIVDTSRVLAGTMRVRLDGDRVTAIGSHVPVAEGHGNFIGIAKLGARGAALLRREMEGMLAAHVGDYYTRAIDALARRGVPVGFVDAAGRRWKEVDTREDLDEALRLFGDRVSP